MEQLNLIVLRGCVGRVTKTPVDETMLIQISLATNYAYIGKDGNPVIETTWHNVIHWGDVNVSRGDYIEAKGRLRHNRYTTAIGNERTDVEVVASSIKHIEGTLSMESRETSFDVYFSPIVNVKCEVKDKNNLTEDEIERIVNLAVDKVIDKGLINEMLQENFDKVELAEEK